MTSSTELLTLDETASRLRLSRRRLYDFRIAGRGPTAFRLGGRGRILYLASEVEQFVRGSWRDAAEHYADIESAEPEPLVPAGPSRSRGADS
jgi:predicted DNA-binding transcriptional regulator AlpA